MKFCCQTLAFAFVLGCSLVSAEQSATGQSNQSEEDVAAQSIYSGWQQNSSSITEQVNLAKALFKGGWTHSALSILRQISPEQWKAVAHGEEKLSELLAYFDGFFPTNALPAVNQKKDPSPQTPYPSAEAFQRGRDALARKENAAAVKFFEQVSPGSPRFGAARFQAASLWLSLGKRERARFDLEQILNQEWGMEREGLEKLVTELSSDWNIRVDPLWQERNANDKKKVIEFALLARARLDFKDQRYAEAVTTYEKANLSSAVDANAERVWALLGSHEPNKALEVLSAMPASYSTFEGYYRPALSVQALVSLRRYSEARSVATDFIRLANEANQELASLTPWSKELPDFIANDLSKKPRFQKTLQYVESLKEEQGRLDQKDMARFPLFRYLKGHLETRLAEAETELRSLRFRQVRTRLADLNDLVASVQIAVSQTYLDERETLAAQEAALIEKEQNSPEDTSQERRPLQARQAEAVQKASESLEQALQQTERKRPELLFRQSELLWELGQLSQSATYRGERISSERLKKMALSLARDTLENKEPFPSRDQALFFVGYVYHEQGNEAQSERYLSEYVRAAPGKESAADAFRLLADSQFEKERYAVAEEAYSQVLKFPKSNSVGYALYKRAWCAYALQNYARALIGFEQAFQWAQGQKESEVIEDLKAQSRKDLITVYAEVGDPRRALSYFQRFLKESVRSWLSELAAEYARRGEAARAEELYASLIELNPTASESLIYRTAILRSLLQLKKWPQFDGEVKALFEAHLHELQGNGFEEPAVFDVERVLREAIPIRHAELGSSSSRQAEDAVLELDKKYLSAFGKWPHAKQAFLLYAGLLKVRKSWTEAAKTYRTYLKNFSRELNGQERETALLNVIDVLRSRDAEEPSGKELTDSAQDLLEACDGILLYYPRSKSAREVAFLRSTILFKYDENERGIRESQRIFERNPKDEWGKKAFNNLRVAYYKIKQWPRLYQWATQTLVRDEEVAPYVDDLRKIREESLFLWAQSELDPQRAAELFVKVARESRDPAVREKGYYNGFESFLKAGKNNLAIAVADEFERVAPQSKDLLSLRSERAAILQAAGDYERALPLLKTPFGSRDLTSNSSVIEEKYNEAAIREALGDRSGANEVVGQLATADLSHTGEPVRQAVLAWEDRRNTESFGKGEVWQKLLKRKKEFEAHPLPHQKSLIEKINEAGAQLQHLAGAFVALSNETKTPSLYRFESYCAVPLLFVAYTDALDNQATDTESVLWTEVAKVTQPLKEQAQSLARGCLSKSFDSGKFGSFYDQVANRWAWTNEREHERAERILRLSSSSAPYWDEIPSVPQESAILKDHLTGKTSEQSWFDLAKARYLSQNLFLTRLTLRDALGRYPHSARLINALAAVEERIDPWASVGSFFEEAAKGGSESAWTNLGLFYLRTANSQKAKVAFALALKTKALKDQKDLEQAIEEFTQGEKKR